MFSYAKRGEYYFIVIHAVIWTIIGSELPILILDTDIFIEPPISTSQSEVSVNRMSSNLLQLIWDLGLVSNPSNSSGGLVQLLYTAVVDVTGVDTPLTFSASAFASGLMISSTQLSATTVTPILVVRGKISVRIRVIVTHEAWNCPNFDLFSMQVMSGENGTIISVTTILSHDPISSSPAFFVSLEEEVPEILLVQFPYYLQIDDTLVLVHEADTRNLTTVLTVDIEVLLTGEVMNLTYFAILDPEHQVESNTSKSVLVNYTTIKQEGIGLMVLY